ncbi:MAG TPA: pyocin knob domain-containing protein [Candidatus Flavonifractor merdigallinarum]|uniref:Pyocin knob domain-containing protein n=1 Tax=Candidatus Flavonifractor merdigallinarum TaxID=2838589 RepID=A0A9D2BXG6_9FIRM|nr:pyocin knob domain-containing protein [Candidatus Flavonifractor merdigallinarum]
MANNPITVPLPQDLPETWATNQIVSPNGVSAGLTPQHGYNYLMQQVNNAQQAAQELGEGIAGLSGDNLPASSDGGETISAALSNKADKVTLLGNVDCNTLFTPGDYIIRMDPATAEQSAACNFPAEPGMWSLSIYATLEITGNNGTVYVARNRDSGNIYSRQALNGSFWPWVKLATATPPPQFDLPLAEGVSGAIRYSKDQMGVVRLLGQVELSSAQSGIISIGTLPEGFRLEYAVTTVCCGWTDGGATIAPCTAVVNADGLVAINAFDASLKVFAVNISFC